MQNAKILFFNQAMDGIEKFWQTLHFVNYNDFWPGVDRFKFNLELFGVTQIPVKKFLIEKVDEKSSLLMEVVIIYGTYSIN